VLLACSPSTHRRSTDTATCDSTSKWCLQGATMARCMGLKHCPTAQLAGIMQQAS
jgi:hypothetical protein